MHQEQVKTTYSIICIICFILVQIYWAFHRSIYLGDDCNKEKVVVVLDSTGMEGINDRKKLLLSDMKIAYDELKQHPSLTTMTEADIERAKEASCLLPPPLNNIDLLVAQQFLFQRKLYLKPWKQVESSLKNETSPSWGKFLFTSIVLLVLPCGFVLNSKLLWPTAGTAALFFLTALFYWRFPALIIPGFGKFGPLYIVFLTLALLLSAWLMNLLFSQFHTSSNSSSTSFDASPPQNGHTASSGSAFETSVVTAYIDQGNIEGAIEYLSKYHKSSASVLRNRLEKNKNDFYIKAIITYDMYSAELNRITQAILEIAHKIRS